jgi:protein-S-isoprenylcysteine O-methyltransferase Ste14
MADFWVKNCYDVYYYLREIDFNIVLNTFTINTFNNFWYPFFISIIFSIDTFIFMFCYMFEANFLKNKIVSVDPSPFGWIVALLCYHPFNALGGNYLSWPATSYPILSNIYLTFVLRILILLLFIFYLFATLSLGTRASNLTNRGIVTHGAYKYIRHPSYISKNLAWWISIIPVISVTNILSMICWSFIYFLRAITEERHLIKDSSYKEYCKKVKYRFIPNLF